MSKKANKIIYDNEVIIDLTADTVEPSKLAKGYTAHDKSGEIIVGENTYDADTSTATARASEILVGKTAFVTGAEVVGEMVDNGGVEGKITDVATPFIVPIGYHDGSGTVSIDDIEKAKIIAGNIKSGITILGVEGTYGGESINVQAKTVTPDAAGQTVLPDEGYDYLSQVTVNPIPVDRTENPQGGITVSIASV